MTETRLSGQYIKSGSIPSSALSGALALSGYSLATSTLGTASGSMSISIASGNYFTATTTDVTNWTFTNVPGSRAVGFVLTLTNGGFASQTWPTSVKWPNGTPPSLTVAGVDTLTFLTDNGGTAWRGVLSMKDSK